MSMKKMTEEEVAAYRAKRNAYMREYNKRKPRKRNRDKERAQNKAYRGKNKEALYAKTDAWREANKDKLAAQRKANYSYEKYRKWREERLAEDPDYFKKVNARARAAPGYTKSYRNNHLKNKYGLTLEQYDAMLTDQGGLCFICKKPETIVIKGKVAELAVDHCHDHQKVRGLLCRHCNSMLGHAKDDPEVLRRAAEYIEKFRE